MPGRKDYVTLKQCLDGGIRAIKQEKQIKYMMTIKEAHALFLQMNPGALIGKS